MAQYGKPLTLKVAWRNVKITNELLAQARSNYMMGALGRPANPGFSVGYDPGRAEPKTLLCVGGPRHGDLMTVRPGDNYVEAIERMPLDVWYDTTPGEIAREQTRISRYEIRELSVLMMPESLPYDVPFLVHESHRLPDHRYRATCPIATHLFRVECRNQAIEAQLNRSVMIPKTLIEQMPDHFGILADEIAEIDEATEKQIRNVTQNESVT